MARLQAARGTEDLLPERIPAFEHVFDACRTTFALYGYHEIRTPLFEETALFVRSLGEVTDVVEKEMFTVQRGDTNVTFRPEGTAPVVRAYLEHNLDKTRAFQTLFYIGPMFRFERPQAGRSRQFYQVGVEALGSRSPLLDVEVVTLAHRCFQAIGLSNYTVHLNSIGDRDDRARFREVLRGYMQGVLAERCEDCQQRFQRNVFRMLDCKQKVCQPTNQRAPRFLDSLGAASRERFEQALKSLQELEVPHVVDPAIVRGFDYYTHLVFEIRCPDLGARDAVCGGGRYDGLIPDLGGPELGAVGFAIGVTPTLLALEIQKHPAVAARPQPGPVLVAPVGDAERGPAFLLCERLRQAGVPCDTDYEDKSLGKLFKAADKRGVRLVVVLGTDELARGEVKVKDLTTGTEETLRADASLAAALRARLEQRPRS